MVDLDQLEDKIKEFEEQLNMDDAIEGISKMRWIIVDIWGEIDLSPEIVLKKVWKDDKLNILLLNQVTMMLGELGEILRDIYLEPEDDNHKPNSDDGKDASNVALHSLMLLHIISEKTGENFHNMLIRAINKMIKLSEKYKLKYGLSPP